MDIAAMLTDAFTRVHEGVQAVTAGIDAEALIYRPDADANSIAWLIWHLTRVQDDHVAELAGQEQVWTAEGWAGRFDLPLDDRDTGYGHTSEQVAAVRVTDPGLLAGYHDAVVAQTYPYLQALDEAALDEIIDRSWDPPVTRGVRLVSVVHDQMEHLGQANYLRGMWERR